MSNLTDSIKELYEDISEGEAKLAADSLVSFFRVLEQVESRLAQTKQRHEPENEYIRNTD
ncbi:MAG: hypothetical protein A3E88_02300 [Legionellales bacterium RIFCSPHIGHO2_12_FULL_35_11]|nr:MAG: hypothetical protein A3E88_02300 [Legionellales bacterium RIFCSPHIGHO2_12_FULL_35_11]